MSKLLDVEVERAAGGYVLENLRAGRVVVACCQGVYFRYLASCCAGVGAEVGPVVRLDAGLAWATAGVAADDFAREHALNEEVEGAADRDILECLLCVIFAEACRIGDYLG